jgi:hypothetical protein
VRNKMENIIVSFDIGSEDYPAITERKKNVP